MSHFKSVARDSARSTGQTRSTVKGSLSDSPQTFPLHPAGMSCMVIEINMCLSKGAAESQ